MTFDQQTRILIDMDGVIADLYPYWLERLNKKLDTNFKKEDITNFYIHDALQVPEKEVYSIIDEPGFFYRAGVIQGSQYVLEKLWNDSRYDCRICSAASYSNNAVREKWMWLQEYFPFIKKEKVIFTKDKSIIDAAWLIDDAPHNIEAFHHGKIVFDQPWNRSLLPSLDYHKRVFNWFDIEKFFH